MILKVRVIASAEVNEPGCQTIEALARLVDQQASQQVPP
jgi:hypothetical protein